MGFSVLLLQCDYQAEVMARASLSYTLKACRYFVCKHFCAPQCFVEARGGCWVARTGVGGGCELPDVATVTDNIPSP